MTDQELLELAARAYCRDTRMFSESAHYRKGFMDGWNPLKDLDQAKRLRHKLNLSSGYDDRFFGPCAYCTYPTGPESCNSIMQSVEEAGGKRAALRRAIVRAAAEIGKSMEKSQ